MPDVLACALHAAGLGWPVFPLIPGGKTPAIRAAHPAGHPCRGECGRTGHGFHDATTDPATITAWWSRWPRANYGISTGPAGLVVIDLDTGKSPARDGQVLPDQGAGEATPPDVCSGLDVLMWAAQRDVAGPGWENTFTVATPSGGAHHYYVAPGGTGSELPPVRSSAGMSGGRITGVGWCIDVRAFGGYVVGPGSAGPAPQAASIASRSPGPATTGYRVLTRTAPAPLPGWLRERITRAGQPGTTPCITGDRRRLARRARPGYADAAIAGELAAIAASAPHDKGGGGRNATVNRAAYKLGRLAGAFALADDDLTADLLAAAAATGLPEREASTAIASGLAQGRANPRAVTTTNSTTSATSSGSAKGRP